MAAILHVEFVKLRLYIMWHLSPCYFASLCKILLKSDNRPMSYGQKIILKMVGVPLLNIKNVHIWSSGCHWLPNMLLCTKFRQNGMIFRWFNDLRYGILLPVSISTISLYWTSHSHHAVEFHLNRIIFGTVMMIYRFSRWRMLRRNFTSGFGLADVLLFRRSMPISKLNFEVITLATAEI